MQIDCKHNRLMAPTFVAVVVVAAAASAAGYCVPRQAFLVTNVTALGCIPGSNLTKWDNEFVW
jgi:hypothetical protein